MGELLTIIRSISDRIARAKFKLPNNNYLMIVINVYGPIQAKTNEDERIRDELYDQLEAILNKLSKRSILFIAGDFNSKIGQEKTDNNCIGRYCRGYRNANGQALVKFSEAHELFAKIPTLRMPSHNLEGRTEINEDI